MAVHMLLAILAPVKARREIVTPDLRTLVGNLFPVNIADERPVSGWQVSDANLLNDCPYAQCAVRNIEFAGPFSPILGKLAEETGYITMGQLSQILGSWQAVCCKKSSGRIHDLLQYVFGEVKSDETFEMIEAVLNGVILKTVVALCDML